MNKILAKMSFNGRGVFDYITVTNKRVLVDQVNATTPKKKRNLRGVLGYTLAAVTCVFVAQVAPSLADTVGEIGAHGASQGQNVGNLVSVVFYVLGMAAGGGAFMKLKANRDNPQQTPLSHAAMLFVVAAGLLFLPETFQSVGDSVYDKGAQKNVIGGTTAIGG